MTTRPTLSELEEQTFSELSGSLFGSQSPTRNSVVGILSKVLSYLAHNLYVFSDRYGRTPWDATGPLLLSFARTCGIEPFLASNSYGSISVNGTGFIPEGTLLKRCDGETYVTINDSNWPSDPIVVRSLNTGVITNTVNGIELTFSTPILGISTNAVVNDPGLTGGQEDETEDNLRRRVLACYRSRCQNGKAEDYVSWVSEYEGVTRVYPIGKANGPGTVKIFFMMDDTYSNGIPAQGDVDIVQAMIDDLIPLGVCATVCAPNPLPIDITINTEPTTNSKRDEITDVLKTTIQGFGPGKICKVDLMTSIRQIYNGCFEIVMPVNDIRVDVGDIAVLGTVSYGITPNV